jgi:azurin
MYPRILALLCALPAMAADLSVTVKTLSAQMKYDQAEIMAEPGQKLRITLENHDDLPHNLVICKPGTDVIAMTNAQMAKADEAVKRNWLPDDPAILAHTKMLNPHEQDTIEFTAPRAGTYPFVCTFPGHAIVMRGKLTVMSRGETFQNLSFRMYLGSWEKLPDFSKLTPHREGTLPERLLDIKLDDYRNEFAVRYEGTVMAPKDGNYRFYLTSDDGSRLLVDDKVVVAHDGIHPAGDIKEGGLQLKQGPHKVVVEYFQAKGGCEIFAAWKGANFRITPLSKQLPEGWQEGGSKKKRNQDTTGMPLLVKAEPVIYRNFIADAGNRAIGVGYPGGVNIAWSAESLNLCTYWRGDFIDAARHWNSRGGGHQPPSGYDHTKPTNGLTPLLHITQQPEAAWPVYQPEGKVGEWKGYELDQKGAPSFRYTWHGVKVTDGFTAEGNGMLPNKETKLHRHLSLEGKLPEHAWLCLATAEKIHQQDGIYECHAAGRVFTVKAEGARISGRNLVLPATAGKLTVTYSWR